MKSCLLAVTPDGWTATGPKPRFAVGEPITGAVTAFVQEPMHCDGLDVWLEAKPTGPGFSTGLSELHRTRVFEGDWSAGDHEIRFSLPGAPLPTWEGTHVGWRWSVVATARVPGSDPESRGELVVELPGAVGVDVSLPPPDPEGHASGAPVGLWLTGMGALAFLVVIAAAGWAIETGRVAEDVGGPVAGLSTVGLLLFLPLYVVLTYRWVSRTGPRWESRMTLQRDGDRLLVAARPPRGRRILRVVGRLVVKERAVWSTGTSDNRKTHVVEHEVAATQADLQPSRHDPDERLGALPLPSVPPAPPLTLSGADPSCGLLWQVETIVHRRPGPLALLTGVERTIRRLQVRPRLE